MSISFDTIRDKASDLLDDTREGLSVMDRYLVRHSVKTKTVITDTKTGKKLSDTEDGYTREFSLLKAIAATAAVFVAAVVLVSAVKNGAKQKKKIKEQKKRIKSLEKVCKRANLEV